jgi:hypothetical protein
LLLQIESKKQQSQHIDEVISAKGSMIEQKQSQASDQMSSWNRQVKKASSRNMNVGSVQSQK